MSKSSVAAIVLNWNDADLIPSSVGSLLTQSRACDVIVVDNGSRDNSTAVIKRYNDRVTPVWNDRNLGFAGGINAGIRVALNAGYEYIALLNNDAEADKDWVKHLAVALEEDKKLGGVTCSLIHMDGKHYDSTGDFYTVWGLPFPRGRGEAVAGQYDSRTDIMAPSGGASMFRARFFKDVGLFDEDFFAYFEDVDLGLRGLASGWQFKFIPAAKVFHATGTTSGRVKNFATYQTLKNLPMLFIKNVPPGLFWRMLPRFWLAYSLFVCRAISRLQFGPLFKSALGSLWLVPKKIAWRLRYRQVDHRHFRELLVNDLPPNAKTLRNLREKLL